MLSLLIVERNLYLESGASRCELIHSSVVDEVMSKLHALTPTDDIPIWQDSNSSLYSFIFVSLVFCQVPFSYNDCSRRILSDKMSVSRDKKTHV